MIRLWNSCAVLLASGLVVGVGLSGAVDAAGKKLKKPEPQALSDAQLVQALHVLKATKLTLEQANHDYGGHRVAAIKAVTAARHQLKQALAFVHKKPPAAGKTGKGKGTGKNRKPEPQNISNLQLAEAIAVLKQTVVFLNQANHDYGGHRASAVRDLHQAIHQLHLALKFEKHRHKQKV